MYLGFQDIFFTYKLISCLLAIGLTISSLEELKAYPVFQSTGLLSWNVSRLSIRWLTKGSFTCFIRVILCDLGCKINIYMRIVCSLLLFVLASQGIISSFLLCFLLFLKILTSVRSGYGMDGSYHMHLLLLFALSIGSLFGIGSSISFLSLSFIAAQLLLAYFIAGISKLISPLWRGPYAMKMIFSTRTYGHLFLHRLFLKRDFLVLLLSWVVILWEVLFFTVLFFSPTYLIVFSLLGCFFHLFNAFFMGLNNFVFAFFAAYPALFYSIYRLHL